MCTGKLLNYHEFLTDMQLADVAGRYGVRVLPKVRLADVLPIQNSGIPSRWFDFALRSHFDFVVIDAQTRPLFAVEFDGVFHAASKQHARDLIKDGICDRFRFPMLRVNSNYLKPQFRGMDMLSWMVEQWFLAEEFQKAQQEGVIPPDEPFDPSFFVSVPGHRHAFPLWLSLDVRTAIAQLHERGQCKDRIPSCLVSQDEEEHYHGVGFLRIDDAAGVYAFSGAKRQAFPVSMSEFLGEILVFEVWEGLKQIVTGTRKATPLRLIYEKVEQFRERYRFVSGNWYGNPQP